MARKNSKTFESLIGTSHVLLHAPHGSLVIPDLARGSLIIDEEEISNEQLAMTDAHTDIMARNIYAKAQNQPYAFINQASRLAIDPERFTDGTEEMLAVGMGPVYTHGSQRQPIRVKNETITKRLVEKYFNPYASALSFLTKNVLTLHGQALIIDLHSYATEPLPYELHSEEPRPQVCIGVDSFHTSEQMQATAETILNDAGYTTNVNTPFAGTYVPTDFYSKNALVSSIMLEIRRDTYMDEKTGKIIEDDFAQLQNTLIELVDNITKVQ